MLAYVFACICAIYLCDDFIFVSTKKNSPFLSLSLFSSMWDSFTNMNDQRKKNGENKRNDMNENGPCEHLNFLLFFRHKARISLWVVSERKINSLSLFISFVFSKHCYLQSILFVAAVKIPSVSLQSKQWVNGRKTAYKN